MGSAYMYDIGTLAIEHLLIVGIFIDVLKCSKTALVYIAYRAKLTVFACHTHVYPSYASVSYNGTT